MDRILVMLIVAFVFFCYVYLPCFSTLLRTYEDEPNDYD